MKVLAIGDVIGRPGRRALAQVVPRLRREYSIDVVVANGENLAGGLGITADTLAELHATGVDVVTSGNHVWHHKEIVAYLEDDRPVIRPLNYPRRCLVVASISLTDCWSSTSLGGRSWPATIARSGLWMRC